MKKLLAIFLPVLLMCMLLCAVIPAAAVSAEDGLVIAISATMDDEIVEEVNAGDEIQVSVNLLNNPGLTSCTVEIGYDPDVFELVTYFDEDEEDYFNQIEVAAKWNASSNKYVNFGPLGKCIVMYQRADAKESQVRKEELFYTATFKVKDTAVSGTYTLSAVVGNAKDIFCNAFNC